MSPTESSTRRTQVRTSSRVENRTAVCQPGGAGGSAGARSVVPLALLPASQHRQAAGLPSGQFRTVATHQGSDPHQLQQVDAVRASKSARHAVLCRRLYVCCTCASVCDTSCHVRIRTVNGRLCCCKCKGDNIFLADMLGRVGLSGGELLVHVLTLCPHLQRQRVAPRVDELPHAGRKKSQNEGCK